ncbi:hypothetical protein N9138_00965 [bacterium]|nr:hypothetical protein [bacterium]
MKLLAIAQQDQEPLQIPAVTGIFYIDYLFGADFFGVLDKENLIF